MKERKRAPFFYETLCNRHGMSCHGIVTSSRCLLEDKSARASFKHCQFVLLWYVVIVNAIHVCRCLLRFCSVTIVLS